MSRLWIFLPTNNVTFFSRVCISVSHDGNIKTAWCCVSMKNLIIFLTLSTYANHMMDFCALLCRSMWLFCVATGRWYWWWYFVCLNCCVASLTNAFSSGCGNKHIFIGLTHRPDNNASCLGKYAITHINPNSASKKNISASANETRKDYKGLGVELLDTHAVGHQVEVIKTLHYYFHFRKCMHTVFFDKKLNEREWI